MIQGRVNAHLEATVRVRGIGNGDTERNIEGVVDTGYNGWLTLPDRLIAQLGLAWSGRGRALLADGSESIFDIYDGRVYWDGQLRRISLDAADSAPLVGTGLLHGYAFRMDTVDGGRVVIRKLSNDSD